jgi:ankyrin repeat protein
MDGSTVYYSLHTRLCVSTASLFGRVAIVRALLRGGANILAANNVGRLPILHEAMRFGRSEVSKQ